MITIENNIYPHTQHLCVYTPPIRVKRAILEKMFGKMKYKGTYYLNYKITNGDETTIVPFMLYYGRFGDYYICTTNKHWAMEIKSFLVDYLCN